MNQSDRLLVERSGLAHWLGLPSGPPNAYRTRKGGILMALETPGPVNWDDDDVAADEEDDDDDEEDDEEDELFADDDSDDLDEDDDEEDEGDEEE